ncbi:hypothetical protein EPA93_19180 [Ktedonosporobacter rubrisoli]|uniref:Uncharacterized protein n=1 Tax=Ktedonosporobacter rubrisoli TaxID=2509675 RepID=A0A4P6JRQ7_KTERU|nr:hypothetical protein [Ktedonosporobacter rubrisoli]QBD78003.1 hypothetical protein EPA93_19180 [Ktedonosporobacter rubrisoli]
MKDRAYVKSLFLAHAAKMKISDLAATNEPYQFTCRLNWIPQRACMLVSSSDYWAKCLHLQKHGITLFVVWKHNSCIPYDVLCLEDGKHYLAYTCAVESTRRTKRTSKVFLGQLLCGVQSAFDTLKEMPYSSRRRYEVLLEYYTHRRKGRPLKVG